jgi:hypothetical protein
MYFLARSWTANSLAAALAGVLFSFNGLTLNFLMWPSHIATFSWLPWVLWLAPHGWQQGGRKLYWAVLAGAMQMLAGGPETILLTWGILFLLACGDWMNARRPKQEDHSQEAAPARGGDASRKQITLRFAGLVLLVGLICAAQVLPFLELVAHSERDSAYSAISPDWSMPIWGWANFLVPLFHTVATSQKTTFPIGQYWTSSYYAGIGAVLLMAVAVRRVPEWRVRLLAILVFLCLVLALGDRGLLYRGLRACFPGIGFVRYPVKFVILVSALAPLLGGVGFAALTRRGEQKLGRFEWGCAIVLLVMIGMIIGLEKHSPMLAGAWPNTWRNGLTRAVFLGLCLLCIAVFLSSQGRRRILCGCLLLTFTWLDFVTHEPTQNPTMPPQTYAPDLVRAQLNPQELPRLGQARVMMSPTAEETLRLYLLPDLEQHYWVHRLAAFPDCNLLDAVPQTYGMFSLAPGPIANLANLPYVRTNLDFSKVMDFMAVSRTTKPGMLFDWTERPTAMPLVTAGQAPVFAEDQAVIDAFFQTNTDLSQTVFLPSEARGVVGAKRCAEARVLGAKFENQRVEIETTAPAPSLVVVSQSWYPVWKAYIDGKPAKLWRANYAFQALQVPAGKHNVELRYQDRAFQAGTVLSFIGTAWVFIGFTRSRHRREAA